jgi:hypothetical protein
MEDAVLVIFLGGFFWRNEFGVQRGWMTTWTVHVCYAGWGGECECESV